MINTLICEESWDSLEEAAKIGGFQEEIIAARRYESGVEETNPVPGGHWVPVVRAAEKAARDHEFWMGVEVFAPIQSAARLLAGMEEGHMPYKGHGSLKAAIEVAEARSIDRVEQNAADLLQSAAEGMDQLSLNILSRMTGNLSCKESILQDIRKALKKGIRKALQNGHSPERVAQSVKATVEVVKSYNLAGFLAGEGPTPPWGLVEEKMGSIKPSLGLL